jgi:hypothetical protein
MTANAELPSLTGDTCSPRPNAISRPPWRKTQPPLRTHRLRCERRSIASQRTCCATARRATPSRKTPKIRPASAGAGEVNPPWRALGFALELRDRTQASADPSLGLNPRFNCTHRVRFHGTDRRADDPVRLDAAPRAVLDRPRPDRPRARHRLERRERFGSAAMTVDWSRRWRLSLERPASRRLSCQDALERRAEISPFRRAAKNQRISR